MKYSKFKHELKNEFNDAFKKEDVIQELKLRPKRNYGFLMPAFIFVAAIFVFFTVITINNTVVSVHNNNINNKNMENYEYLNTKDFVSLDKLDNMNDIDKAEFLNHIFLEPEIYYKISYSANATSDLIIEGDEETAALTPKESGSKDSANSYETNNQKDGVIESDIAKFDGKYVYYLSKQGNNSSLIIYDLNGNKIIDKKLIELFDYEALINDNTYSIYLKSNLYRYSNYELQLYNDNIIIMNSYMVLILKFNDNKLKKIYSNEFSHLLETRLIDNVLYIVGAYNFTNIDKYFSNEVYYISSGRYISPYLYKIMKINLDNYDIKVVDNISNYTNGILYMDKNYIALYNNTYFDFKAEDDTISYENIYSLALFDLDLNPIGNFKLPGHILNQYSIDIKDNYLRVVTTNNSRIENKINSLSIYNIETKEKISSIDEGLGKGLETVKSVTFNDDLCYVVTFRTTDPLYEIDLSDPTNPKILSELEMPGYSEYLYSFKLNDKDYVLGVGNDAQNKKISLFEVNNGKNIIIDNFIISHSSYSDSLYEESDLYVNFIWDCFSYGKKFFFYNDENSLYFGVQLSYENYYLFEINPKNEAVIAVKEVFYTEINSKLFLYKGVIYIPTPSKLIIKDWY